MGIVIGLYDIGVTVLCKPLPGHPLACVLPQPHSHTILIRAATQGMSSVSESIILLKASLSEIHVTPPPKLPTVLGEIIEATNPDREIVTILLTS